MKDSYGTYDGSRPEPPYQTTEDDRCDRIEYLEERLSAVCRRLEINQPVGEVQAAPGSGPATGGDTPNGLH